MPRLDASLIPAALLLVAAMVVGWFHVERVQFFCDDSYISYRYSENLAAGQGLVYNPGERVEGYTNFLWVVLLALGIKLGLPVEGFSLFLGLACLLLILTGTVLAARRLFPGRTGPTLAAGAVLLLTSLGPMILWSTAGLESSLFGLASLAAILAYQRWMSAPRGLVFAGALYGLSTMVRPDGLVFGATAGLHLVLAGLLRRRPDLRNLLVRGGALLGGFLAVHGPFVLWRQAYYSDWFPNTWYVKAGSSVQFELGRAYLRSFATEYPGVVTLTAVGLLAALLSARYSAVRLRFTHFALSLGGFAFYIAWAGGDYMALYRFLLPVLPLAVLFIAAALDTSVHLLAGVLRSEPARLGLAGTAFGALAFWFFQPSVASAAGETDTDLVAPQARMKRNTSYWTTVGDQLGKRLPKDVVIATTAAGAIPYCSGLKTIDQSGLCDRYTAKVESDPWLIDRPGHGKQATRKHLIELAPHLVIWHPQIMTAGKSPIVLPLEGYVWRMLHIPGLTENGEPLFLYFQLRADLADRFARFGMIAPGGAPVANGGR